VPVIRFFIRKIMGLRTLYLQLLFVTLAFTLIVVTSGVFVNYMLKKSLVWNADNMLALNQVRIVNELKKTEAYGIPADFPLEYISNFVISMRLVEGGYGFLADENFNIIAHRRTDFVGRYMKDISPGFRKIAQIMEKGVNFTKVEAYNYEGIYSIYYCKRVDNGWYLGITTPINVYYRDLRTLLWFLSALGVIMMLVVDYILIRIDAARRKVDERIQLMLDSAPFGVTLIDRNYNIVDCNQAALAMFGIDDKHDYRSNFLSYSPERQPSGEKSDSLMREYIDSVFKNHSGRFLWTHQKIDGELVPCEVTFTCSSYRGQKVTVGYTIDLRKEQEMQAKMDEAEAMTRIMFDKTPMIIDLWSSDLKLIDANEEAVKLLGMSSKQEYIEKFMDNLPEYQPDGEPSKEKALRLLSKTLEEGYHRAEWLHKKKNGEPLPCEITFIRINHRNDDSGIVVYLRDLRETKATMAEIDKRFAQQSIMTSISQSFLSTEDMGALIANAFKMIGEFMGIDQILMYVKGDNTYTCKNEWLNPKLGLSSRVGEIFTLSKAILDFSQRAREQKLLYVTSENPAVREALAPLRVYSNNYIMTLVFLGDDLYAVIDFSKAGSGYHWNQNEIDMASYITNTLISALNRRSIERQLVTAKEAAEESNRAKGIFLARMSHEIRTPMNVILGISEIQLHSKLLSPIIEEAFKHIYDSGNLLLNIINDILDFSKIEAGRMEIVPGKYDIPSLINDTVQLNHLRYESKPIDFRLKVDENTPLELFGDEIRLKQILNNLLSNAFKYTDEGKIELSVHAEPTQDEKTVTLVFKVSDTGQGLSKEQIEQLFVEYSRFNLEANRGVTGTGLGMSIVKRIVDMMGGEIQVESAAGEGSTFTIRLPQGRIGPSVCGAELVESLRNFRFPGLSITKKTQVAREYMPYGSVLVVDDVASNLYVAKGLLTPYGLKIETASSGIITIEKIKDGNVYDIIFMDHMMPVLDGMETTSLLRKLGYTQPIVALTANAVVGQSELFLANGFDGFISKPIDSRELDAMLVRFVRDKQPREVIEKARREQKNREGSVQKADDITEIEKFFVLDAENAISVIEGIYEKLQASDAAAIASFTTAVHGMKSALANIGEAGLSATALRLEQAGREQNIAVITEETPAFMDALRTLIVKYKLENNDEIVEISGEDTIYLRDKLLDIKKACQTFDITASRNALNDLRQKTWPRYVNEILDEISVHLLHSAFNKAAAVAENTAENTAKG